MVPPARRTGHARACRSAARESALGTPAFAASTYPGRCPANWKASGQAGFRPPRASNGGGFLRGRQKTWSVLLTSSQTTLAIQVGLSPVRDAHLGKESGLCKGIFGNELLGRLAAVHVDDIDAAAGIGPVVIQLGAAGQQQVLVALQEFEVRRTTRLTHMLMGGLVPSLDQ